MIASLEGELDGVRDGAALLRSGDVTYEILVPAFDQMRLAASTGERMRFHTLHYLESQGQGASFWPRLIGFASADERTFFELFTTVKGIGNRKALRALQLPVSTVAQAIAERDVATLQSLPEIGKKTAEAIVLELRDKMNRFLGSTELREPKPAGGPAAALLADAIAVLVQLGEPRPMARQLAERAVSVDRTLDSADAVVTAALRLKELG
jgi:Holliday junction DNA helicase RuvA